MRLMLVTAALVGVLSLSGGSGSAAGPRVELVAGTLAIQNSLDGQAIFSADNLGPGHAAIGTVTVSNTGTLTGALSLSQSAPTGAALAHQLQLVVRDLTGGTTVYSGPLTGLGTVSVGTLGPGAARVYGFTATLPASAADAGQADSTEVAYTWTATETTTARPPPAPPGPGTLAKPDGPDLRQPLRLRVRLPARQRVASFGRVIVFARCNQVCRLQARGRLLGSRASGAKAARVRAGREKRLVLKLSRRALVRLRHASGRVRVRVTVTGRTAAGARKTVTRRARTARVHRQRKRPPSGHAPDGRCAAARC